MSSLPIAGTRAAPKTVIPGFGITFGLTLAWLGLIVLIPLAGLFLKTMELTLDQFIAIVTSARVLNALKISFGIALAAAAINLVFGFFVVWALTRYEFPGRRLFDAIVDIPFALPTAVAGIALTTLYAAERLDRLPARAARHQGRLYAARHSRRSRFHRPAFRRAHGSAGPDRSRIRA